MPRTARSGWLAASSNVAILSEASLRVSRSSAASLRIRLTLSLTVFSDGGSSAKTQHSPSSEVNPCQWARFPINHLCHSHPRPVARHASAYRRMIASRAGGEDGADGPPLCISD